MTVPGATASGPADRPPVTAGWAVLLGDPSEFRGGIEHSPTNTARTRRSSPSAGLAARISRRTAMARAATGWRTSRTIAASSSAFGVPEAPISSGRVHKARAGRGTPQIRASVTTPDTPNRAQEPGVKSNRAVRTEYGMNSPRGCPRRNQKKPSKRTDRARPNITGECAEDHGSRGRCRIKFDRAWRDRPPRKRSD